MRRTDAVHSSDGVVRKAGVGFAGLATCGRVWLCPVCNAKVMARRNIELGMLLAWAHANGLLILWGSTTSRHTMNTPLADSIGLHQDAWRKVVGGKTWRTASTTKRVPHEHVGGQDDDFGCSWDCERQWDVVDTGSDGRVGYVRAAEITWGHHGWHPHFHPLIVWRGTKESAELFAEKIVHKWVDSVRELGGEAEVTGGQQLKVLTPDEYTEKLGDYMTKSTYALAFEATWSQGKTGQGRKGKKRAIGTVSHWSLLADIEQMGRTGEMIRAAHKWQEFEEATHGHRMLMWSRGLRSFTGMDEQEQTDEELAAQEVGTKEDTVCFITPEGWATIRDEPTVLAAMLRVLESGGWTELRDYLDWLGVEYFTPAMAAAGWF